MIGLLEIFDGVSTEVVSFEEQPKKLLPLYKHGDDLRQEPCSPIHREMQSNTACILVS